MRGLFGVSFCGRSVMRCDAMRCGSALCYLLPGNDTNTGLYCVRVVARLRTSFVRACVDPLFLLCCQRVEWNKM